MVVNNLLVKIGIQMAFSVLLSDLNKNSNDFLDETIIILLLICYKSYKIILTLTKEKPTIEFYLKSRLVGNKFVLISDKKKKT